MAQQALGPGATVPRRRVLFGLLDADGWAWAGLKAVFWLIVIIFMLGYLPDRAYYFTVNRTVDLGLLPGRRSTSVRRCQREPAVPGAGRRARPWHPSDRAREPLPAGAAHRRRRGPGRREHPVHRRHRRQDRPVDGVRRPGDPAGNFDAWEDGPPLPEPRSDATVARRRRQRLRLRWPGCRRRIRPTRSSS